MSFSFAKYQSLKNHPDTTNGVVSFWHETEPDYGIFSNWAPTPLFYDNRQFSSSEHLFMYMKAKLFDDTSVIKLPENQNLAQFEIKKLGRQVQNFKQETWDKHKYHFMYVALLTKAEQTPEFTTTLQNTKNTLIVEASPRDTIWGIGIKASDPRIETPANWLGENALGTLLMMVRDDLPNNK